MRKPVHYFVCERTGQKLPRSQLVVEQGTGFRVGRKHVDPSQYTLKTHPQGHIKADIAGDTRTIDPSRSDTNIENMAPIIVTEDGPTDYIIDDQGNPIYFVE